MVGLSPHRQSSQGSLSTSVTPTLLGVLLQWLIPDASTLTPTLCDLGACRIVLQALPAVQRPNLPHLPRPAMHDWVSPSFREASGCSEIAGGPSMQYKRIHAWWNGNETAHCPRGVWSRRAATLTPMTHSVTLTCHPQTRTDVVRGIAAHVGRSPGGTLAIEFVLDADLRRLRIPPPHTSCVVHGLWEHTCFEAFIALENSRRYHEFNFAPSGEWALYAFQSYREIAPLPDETVVPEITVRCLADRLELDAVVRLDSLSAVHATSPLRLALSAVIEDDSGSLSYWALRHPPGKPDFHHPDAFALTTEAPGVDSAVDPR